MRFVEEWHRCTHATDRWLALVSALGVIGPCLWTLQSQPESVVAIRDAKAHEIIWPLRQNTVLQVDGHLGSVHIEVRDQRVRLLEYQSPRLVGTMTGWIGKSGQVTACIPCGVIIKIKGQEGRTSQDLYDGVVR
ncbi:MAG: NusG domain II-containing protein [Magnetococcales bacterium]|nr:NusG domain II-containing protein [Magnetococcales bacterium]